jgi:SAM-dependent methyltransferase
MPLQFKNYEHTRLRKLARLCKKGSVLDLGYAQLPNPYFTNVYRVGMDLSPPSEGTEYEETITGNVLEIEKHLGGREFDYIVAGEFIEHLENPYSFLRLIREYLAPGGKLLISTPNPVGFPVVLFEWLNIQRLYYTSHHTYLFPPRWVKRILVDSGFKFEQMIGVGFLLPMVTLPCPATVSYQTIYVATKH